MNRAAGKVTDYHRSLRDILVECVDTDCLAPSYQEIADKLNLWTIDAARGFVCDLADWGVIRMRQVGTDRFTYELRGKSLLPGDNPPELQQSNVPALLSKVEEHIAASAHNFDCGHPQTPDNSKKCGKHGVTCKACWKAKSDAAREVKCSALKTPQSSVDGISDAIAALVVESNDHAKATTKIKPPKRIADAGIITLRLDPAIYDFVQVETLSSDCMTMSDFCGQLIGEAIGHRKSAGTKPMLRGQIMREWKKHAPDKTYGEFATDLIELGLNTFIELLREEENGD